MERVALAALHPQLREQSCVALLDPKMIALGLLATLAVLRARTDPRFHAACSLCC
jgi:hypothetical protein